MAIEILTGVPGGGKTYYAVSRIDELCATDEKCLILHNIDGLCIVDNRCLSVEFTSTFFRNNTAADYISSLRREYNLDASAKIYVFVDEAQRFFPPELKDPEVFFFFDFHRHYGIDVFLITQHEKKLSFKLSSLAEVEIRAVSGRINPLGSFVYKYSSGGEQYATKRLRKDARLFRLYTSFRGGTEDQQKSKFRYVVAALVVAGVVVWVLFFHVFSGSFERTAKVLEHRKPITAPEKNPVLSVLNPRPDQAPAPTAPAPDVGAVNSTAYLGPEIKDYSSGRDSVRVTDDETGLDVWVSVADFVAQYPPHLYGYGYFHSAGRRFVQLSGDGSEQVFPVKNAVFVRQFIHSEPSAPAVAKQEKPSYPLEYLNKSSGMPDRDGYLKSDYERIYARRHGMQYEDKKDIAEGGANASLQLD